MSTGIIWLRVEGAIELAAVCLLYFHVLAIGLIWCGHIAFDRVLGYGLKSADSFNKTHLDLDA